MTLFKGSGVALVTPFKEDHSIDYDVYQSLLDFHLESSTDAIIVAGTTGEASTLTDEEQLELIDFTVRYVDGRIPVIAGTGSNDTRHGIRLCQEAEKRGADGLLCVTPYYNKTSQRGLYEHFKAIAEAVTIPIILYNVPGRTQMNLLPQTVFELSQIENIVGLKDATGDLSQCIETIRLCGEDFAIYSGNDDVVVPVLSVGGCGVISVVANVYPQETHDMVHAYLQGDPETSRKLQLMLKPVIDALFIEANPIPVKYAMELLGYRSMQLRLPLVEAAETTKTCLTQTMKAVEQS